MKKGDLPKSEEISQQVLSFPHHQYLNEEEIKYVSDSINEFYEK